MNAYTPISVTSLAVSQNGSHNTTIARYTPRKAKMVIFPFVTMIFKRKGRASAAVDMFKHRFTQRCDADEGDMGVLSVLLLSRTLVSIASDAAALMAAVMELRSVASRSCSSSDRRSGAYNSWFVDDSTLSIFPFASNGCDSSFRDFMLTVTRSTPYVRGSDVKRRRSVLNQENRRQRCGVDGFFVVRGKKAIFSYTMRPEAKQRQSAQMRTRSTSRIIQNVQVYNNSSIIAKRE